jgi:hypothetical protein
MANEEQFDFLPDNSGIRYDLLPAYVPVPFTPTADQELFAVYLCALRGINVACRALSMAPSRYYSWRKSDELFAAWIDAYVAQYQQNAIRFAEMYLATKGLELLVGIAEDQREDTKTRIVALRELREMAGSMAASDDRREKVPHRPKSIAAAPIGVDADLANAYGEVPNGQ